MVTENEKIFVLMHLITERMIENERRAAQRRYEIFHPTESKDTSDATHSIPEKA